MIWSLITTLIAVVIFMVYNLVAISYFGIPISLSNTYYLYEEKHKGLGLVFTMMMWTMGMLLMPGWIEISMSVGPWMSYFAFLAFITAACIVFVGTAPRYREDLEGDVHMISAGLCALSALLWCFIVCWNIWYVPLIGMVIAVALGFITKSWKSSRDYWLEVMAFYATFATIIVECIIMI